MPRRIENPKGSPGFSRGGITRDVAPTPQRESDRVEISFDWVPAVTNRAIITFLVSIVRGDRESRIKFEIDLGLLQTNELEKIHGVLSARVAGVDNAVSVTRLIAWLLELSIVQTQPELPLDERQLKVRQLLLAQK